MNLGRGQVSKAIENLIDTHAELVNPAMQFTVILVPSITGRPPAMPGFEVI
jgi:hypothetical protein